MKTQCAVFRLGDRVVHPEHGAGVITQEGEEYLGVLFDEHGEALIKFESSGMCLAGEAHENPTVSLMKAENTGQTLQQWPESTFIFESGNENSHAMGGHWEPFYEDMQEALERLPEIIEQATPQTGYAEFYPPHRIIPDHWDTGWILAWPYRDHGISVIVKHTHTGNEVVSIFPFYDHGAQITLALDHIRVWGNGVEAQVDAKIGEALISFYDTQFYINRACYEAGRSYDFLITGIAYKAGLLLQKEIKITQKDVVVDWLNRNVRADGEPLYEKEMTVNTEGMSLLMPVPEWDRDDYQFSGPVTEVKPVEDLLGQKAWLVSITVLREIGPDNQDVDMKFIITERAWQEDTPLMPGQTITGTVWLQGRLWVVGGQSE